MRFVPIAPINLQYDYTRSYTFGLAHKLQNKQYASYFRQVAPNTHSILDNGAYEGASLPVEQLLRLVDTFGFKEVALPDVLGKAKKSTQLTIDALKYVANKVPRKLIDKVQFMLIPQGNTPVEWASSMLILSDFHRLLFGNKLYTIGVPRITNDLPGGRTFLLSQYILKERENFPFDVHLLGISEKLPELKTLSVILGAHIRTIDSAKPFVYALNDIGISAHWAPDKVYKRPEGYFEASFNEEQKILAEQNVIAYEVLCNHGI